MTYYYDKMSPRGTLYATFSPLAHDLYKSKRIN